MTHRRLSGTTARHRNRAQFFSQITRHLDRLYHFIDHELQYHRAVGDVLPGELTTDDVVDQVLLRAYRELAGDAGDGEIDRSRLLRIAIEELETEVARVRAERERTAVRLEEDVPETPPPESVTSLGEEILYFHQPDEDLRLEDVLPDMDIETPEEHAERTELRVCVNTTLTALPPQWRRALLLRYVDGLTGAALGRALGTTEAEAARLLGQARAELRRKLIEAGCTLRPSPLPHARRPFSDE